MNPQLSQQELAAWIDREGLAFEYLCHNSSVFGDAKMVASGIGYKAVELYQEGYEIRLAPGALNEWGLPIGTEPHNPDGLTPEQITEGGKYRALAKCEVDGRHRGRGYLEYWDGKKWFSGGFGSEPSTTYRVPITTPLPAVKESLTPQPATRQSKTPRTDAAVTGNSDPCSDEYEDLAIFARTLETELTAALAQRDEARRLLGEVQNAAVLLLNHLEDVIPEQLWDSGIINPNTWNDLSAKCTTPKSPTT